MICTRFVLTANKAHKIEVFHLLAKRMLVSHYRIYDMFDKPVSSLAIFADKSKTWRPNYFLNRHWGTTLFLHFPTRKLQDYNSPETLGRLEKSTNPFAHLVAATLYAQETRPDSKQREEKKYHLVRKLYGLGLSKEKVRHFYQAHRLGKRRQTSRSSKGFRSSPSQNLICWGVGCKCSAK